MTATDHTATAEHTATGGHVVTHDEVHVEHYAHKDSFYVKIAAILAGLTALEVSTYYFDFGPLFLPTLLTLMCIKFFMVAWFFMHLRDDAKIFGRLFYTGLFLAVAVYVVALSTFQFFLK
jgi:cytochrome c oxidase subunit IV